MRRWILFISLIIFATAVAGTYRTEVIDGANGFQADEQLNTVSGTTLYVTWDALNIYFAIDGANLDGTRSWWIFGDTDQTDGSGASAGPAISQIVFNNTQNTIYEPNFAIRIISSGVAEVYNWTGAAWSAPISLAAAGGVWNVNTGTDYAEASIPWASSPSAEVGISSAVVNDGSGVIDSGFPTQNPVDGNNEFGWVYEFFDLGAPMPTAGFSPNSADNSLPVSLSSFVAHSGNGEIRLTWQTQSEVNNAGFIVERSTTRNGGYQEIASFVNFPDLRGQGNSNQTNNYHFTDRYLLNGIYYYYRLVDVDIAGRRANNGPVVAMPNEQGSDINNNGSITDRYMLHKNYPNPFNPETNIRFEVPESREGFVTIRLAVYNIAGQLVKTLYSGEIQAGTYQLTWDGRNGAGVRQASGLYFLRFSSRDWVQTRRMMLIE